MAGQWRGWWRASVVNAWRFSCVQRRRTTGGMRGAGLPDVQRHCAASSTAGVAARERSSGRNLVEAGRGPDRLRDTAPTAACLAFPRFAVQQAEKLSAPLKRGLSKRLAHSTGNSQQNPNRTPAPQRRKPFTRSLVSSADTPFFNAPLQPNSPHLGIQRSRQSQRYRPRRLPCATADKVPPWALEGAACRTHRPARITATGGRGE